MKRVTVFLREEEYAEVKEMAGLVPLSTWFKHLALTDHKFKTFKGISEVARDAIAQKPADAVQEHKITGMEEEANGGLNYRRKGTCAHGTAKGYNCWQCGGLAKVNA